VIADAHFRYSGGRREAIAAPSDSTSIAKLFSPSQATWGKVTSRKPDPHSRAALELAAFRLGVKPATLVKAIVMGVFDG
jgi:predicted kinase